jgi:anti-anti-sigma factor
MRQRASPYAPIWHTTGLNAFKNCPPLRWSFLKVMNRIGKVEEIYHLLVAVPTEDTSQKLKSLWDQWNTAGRHQSVPMLAMALGELLRSVPLELLSRARALLVYGFTGADRVPATQIEESARRSLEIFAYLRDNEAVADACSLLGDALSVQGRREEALREYQEAKRIMLELSQRDPGNAGWLRDLSVSYSNVGGILEAEGRREEALREYQEAKRIVLELSQRDPGNAGWLRDFSVSHHDVGGILEAEGRREGALCEYQEAKRIVLELSRHDPGNPDWLRDFSVSHHDVGGILESESGREEPVREYQKSKRGRQESKRIMCRVEDSFGIISFAGALTSGPVLHSQIEGVRQFINFSKLSGIVLLLSGVSRIDTSGLGQLTSVYTMASRRGCPLRMVGASADLMRVLKMTRLDILLRASPDIESAKAEMGDGGRAKPASLRP